MKEIRLALVGSRGFNDYERLCAAVSALVEREQLIVVGIVSGGARGVDSLGARYAHEHGFKVITTTLASSRWKSLDQINEAGRFAVAPYPDVVWWEQNWRKGGLSERRLAIIKEYGFYNQRYCGCEFSRRPAAEDTTLHGR